MEGITTRIDNKIPASNDSLVEEETDSCREDINTIIEFTGEQYYSERYEYDPDEYKYQNFRVKYTLSYPGRPAFMGKKDFHVKDNVSTDDEILKEAKSVFGPDIDEKKIILNKYETVWLVNGEETETA
ncbi:MAG: hypothetical protein GY828_03210 [Candidatus Gracilibacteria bacterium]|nr:hypothetical protein [Candidatus Gracilibacteria bacterium]